MLQPAAGKVRRCFESAEDAPSSLLIMLRGYFDESGHEGQEWVSVAGFALHVAVDDLELLSRSCQYETDQCAF